MSAERPGGWVDGIGWCALVRDLDPSDEVTPALSQPPLSARRERSMAQWNYPVIVTRWADGTRPEPSVLAAYDATADETGDEQVSWEVEDDIGWIDPGYASEEAARSAAVDYQAAAPDAGPHYVVKAVTRRTRTRFPVAAGGATPDPAEQVWRCVGDTGPGHYADGSCSPLNPDSSGCGWVPSEEGPTA